MDQKGVPQIRNLGVEWRKRLAAEQNQERSMEDADPGLLAYTLEEV